MAVAASICGDANEQDTSIIDIEEIQAHDSLIGTTNRKLVRIKGFSDIKVEKVKEAAKKVAGPNTGGQFVTAAEHGHFRKKCIRISTGSKQLDACLNGGFQTMSISEVYGEFNTEGTFRPERIAEIAERFGVDPDQALENIVYARAQNTEMQQEMLEGLAQNFATDEYRLLIIDSIMALYRSDFIGRGELSERQSALNAFLRRATQMAEEFNLVVFMTNQVMSDPGASALFAGADGRKPAGGHILAHASTTRVLLRKGRGEERVAKVVDSPDCPEREATYIITTGGINDPEKA
ncbi:hypothetical protein EYC84_010760 [Monilinia fructicola]|uniref:Meiotic recombination protein dmc1 n=1 Tax=Monilinia fructicola TaxID=38448 RepID=A0A5M9J753_MONFR|nr:hypothetical protein EYC84_010760 [Monilinia fructicola]